MKFQIIIFLLCCILECDVSAQAKEKYVFTVGEESVKRLEILDSVRGLKSRELLSTAGLKTGMRVIEVGCGTGSMTLWIAQQIGPKGEILATDIDEEQLEITKQRAEKLNIKNIKFLQWDVLQNLHLSEFDLVYSRFVLVHTTNGSKAIQNMLNLLKDGGVIVCEEPDLSSLYSYPENVHFQKAIHTL